MKRNFILKDGRKRKKMSQIGNGSSTDGAWEKGGVVNLNPQD